MATLCHIITRLSGSRKPGLKEYKAYRFACVLRRHTRKAGWSIRKTAGEVLRKLGSGADQASSALGEPGGWAPTEFCLRQLRHRGWHREVGAAPGRSPYPSTKERYVRCGSLEDWATLRQGQAAKASVFRAQGQTEKGQEWSTEAHGAEKLPALAASLQHRNGKSSSEGVAWPSS